MPYFFILPAYVALFIALIVIAIITRFVARFRLASGYIVAGAIGTLIGFVIINIVVWIVGLFPVWLNQKVSLPDWLQQVSKFFVAGTLLIGPFIGSAIGILLGFAAGFYFVYRRRKRNSA
jgi:hypothetical protein